MSEPERTSKKSLVQGKPFPWRCPECGQDEVHPAVVSHKSRICLDGKTYTVELPELRVPRCRACGELVFDNDAEEQITRTLRKQLGLLSPEQIQKNREELGLDHHQLAEQLRVDAETVSLWENGLLIQSPAMDGLLRLYFGIPEVRAALIGSAFSPTIGTHVQN
jgi:putative zinc finger/helix-turn-helix YgiT family protein